MELGQDIYLFKLVKSEESKGVFRRNWSSGNYFPSDILFRDIEESLEFYHVLEG